MLVSVYCMILTALINSWQTHKKMRKNSELISVTQNLQQRPHYKNKNQTGSQILSTDSAPNPDIFTSRNIIQYTDLN